MSKRLIFSLNSIEIIIEANYFPNITLLYNKFLSILQIENIQHLLRIYNRTLSPLQLFLPKFYPIFKFLQFSFLPFSYSDRLM